MTSSSIKNKFKLSSKKIIKYVMILFFLVSLFLTFYTASYLYNNFYLVITQSEQLVLLKERVSIDTINIKKFESIINNIENKANFPAYQDLKNIFR
jgi:hypothetical protein